jgi:tetratricopeptide (TPR) repeat protein
MGQLEEGVRAIERAVELLGRTPLYLGILGFSYAMVGRTREAQKILEQLQELAQKIYVPAFAFAAVYQAFGEIDKFFDWLEKTVEEYDSFHLFHFTSLFDSIRSHPRYHALLRKMNLEP